MGARMTKSNRSPSGLDYVGSDTEATSTGTASETTLANLTIPANSVKTRLVITAPVGLRDTAVNGKSATFRLKTGTLGGETTKATILLYEPTASAAASYTQTHTFVYVESTLTFTGQTSILITSEHVDATATTTSACFQLLVVGQ